MILDPNSTVQPEMTFTLSHKRAICGKAMCNCALIQSHNQNFFDPPGSSNKTLSRSGLRIKSNFFHTYSYGTRTGTIWLDNVRCSGSELTLTSCERGFIGSTDCSHSEDVAIDCRPGNNTYCKSSPSPTQCFCIHIDSEMIIGLCMHYVARPQTKHWLPAYSPESNQSASLVILTQSLRQALLTRYIIYILLCIKNNIAFHT